MLRDHSSHKRDGRENMISHAISGSFSGIVELLLQIILGFLLERVFLVLIEYFFSQEKLGNDKTENEN